MGRGDKKTKKGKIAKGSFGKSRKARPAKKAATKKQDQQAKKSAGISIPADFFLEAFYRITSLYSKVIITPSSSSLHTFFHQ